MKYRYLYILILVILLSMSTVTAQECSVNNTQKCDVVLSSVEYIIDDSNYCNYFDNESGMILENSSISDGDTIKFGNINNKNFILDKSLNITSNSTYTLNNVSFYLINGSNNSTVENLIIINNGTEKSAIYINDASDISILNCKIDFSGVSDNVYAIYADLVDNFRIMYNYIAYEGKNNGSAIKLIRSAAYIYGNQISSNSNGIKVKNSTVYIFNNGIEVDDYGFGNSSAIYIENSYGEIFYDRIIYFGNTNGLYVNSLLSIYNSNINVSYNNFYASLISCPTNYVNSSLLYIKSVALYFEKCENLTLSNNDIQFGYNDVIGLEDAIFGVYLNDCNDAMIVNNTILGEGYTYIEGLSIFGKNFNIINNTIEISSDENTTIGINILSQSSGIVQDNTVLIYSLYLAYGIDSSISYLEDLSAVNYIGNTIIGESHVLYGMNIFCSKPTTIDNNKIKLYGNYTLGISSLVFDDMAIFTNNEIIVNGLKDDTEDVGDFVPAQTVGIILISPSQIKNNEISSTASYSIINYAPDSTITNNTLNASILLGDDSVLDLSYESIVENNTPVATQYLLTNDTFFLFFDYNGYLRDTISADLLFTGNFSNLVDELIIDRPTILMGDNAVLYNMGIDILSGNVDVLSFVFVSDNLTETIRIINSTDIFVYKNYFNVTCLNEYENDVIEIIGSDNVFIQENSIYSMVQNGVGIVLDSCQNSYIANNTIGMGDYSIYSCGIYIEGNSSGNIKDNNIVIVNSFMGDGICSESGELTVSDNRITVLAYSAYCIYLECAEAFIDSNIIFAEGNLTNGIVCDANNISILFNYIFTQNDGDVNLSNVTANKGIQIIGDEVNVRNNYVYTHNAKYTVDIIRKGNVTGNELVASEYTGDASVDYDVSKAYVANNTPTMYAAILTGEDHVMYYKDGTRYYVNLTDKFGKPLAGSTVVIRINGVNYTRTVDADGTTSIPLGLNSGNYTVTASYAGVGYYSNASVENTITILSTVWASDIVKIFRNGTQYFANFVDNKGVSLKNTDVTFNINGVMYTRTTNESGWAKLNINLPPGTYILTAINPVTGEQYASKVTVLSNIVENYDLTKYYKNASQYSLRLLDDKGNPVGAGVSIQLNINGVFYTRTSDENGYVKLNINLPPGTYIITAEYKGLRMSNIIKVLTVLEANDLVMKYHDGSQFKAKVLDGQGKPYKGQTVTYNINGVFYTKISDDNGMASLTINLPAGEYIITSMYNGLNVANKITITG